MKTYTLTELSNKSGEVVEAAHRGPVTLTSRGRRKFVLLSADHYDQLAGLPQRRAVHVDDLSDTEADIYAEAFLTLPEGEKAGRDD